MRSAHLYIAAFILLFAGLGKADPAWSQRKNPDFIFPLACALGTDCWAVNYVDVDPSDSAKDFQCGSKTYNDHKGTDFAVRSLADVQRGVAVMAAKEGKVSRVRDGETDTIKAEADLEAIRTSQKECGNAVFINHSNGLFTLYCHLKKDSIVVAPGDEVTAGQKIAELGHSGLTELPHLHFGVVWEGGVVDPYTGALDSQGCNQYKQSLWAPGQKLDYMPFALYDAGFSGGVPDFDAIKEGAQSPEILAADSAALVFWGAFYGVSKGDEITLKIIGPNARTYVERKVTQATNKARQYYYTGRKVRATLPPGTYTGTATISRNGQNQQLLEKSVNIR